MKAEREMLSPKSKKNFDEKHTDDWWAAQDSKTRANRKNLEIAAAAEAQAVPSPLLTFHVPPSRV